MSNYEKEKWGLYHLVHYLNNCMKDEQKVIDSLGALNKNNAEQMFHQFIKVWHMQNIK